MSSVAKSVEVFVFIVVRRNCFEACGFESHVLTGSFRRVSILVSILGDVNWRDAVIIVLKLWPVIDNVDRLTTTTAAQPSAGRYGFGHLVCPHATHTQPVITRARTRQHCNNRPHPFVTADAMYVRNMSDCRRNYTPAWVSREENDVNSKIRNNVVHRSIRFMLMIDRHVNLSFCIRH